MGSTLKERHPRLAETIDVLESMATILGVIGLIFVYKQLKINEDETSLNTVGQVYSQMVDIDKVFLANPEARLYIYNNLSPEDLYPYATPAQNMLNQAKAEGTAEMMLDFFSQIMLVQNKLGDAAEGWKAYISDIYKCSPALRKRYELKREWYKNEDAGKVIEQAREEMLKGTVQCDEIKIPKI